MTKQEVKSLQEKITTEVANIASGKRITEIVRTHILSQLKEKVDYDHNGVSYFEGTTEWEKGYNHCRSDLIKILD